MEDYKVIRAIGKGSFGKVYLVRHVKENRQYVMKVIKLKGIPQKEREACRNEVQLMKRLAHPNIVAYKDSFFANGQDNLCIVMTYCDGGDLSARLAAAGGQLFKEDQIMHWFVQIALATHYMHENKVLHRDIKTQNVFLLGNGRLVMGDLGISKVLDGNAQFASTQIGTPYYMSPELFKNKPYNHKSDVWALGCVLYELCTLHHPFDATSLQGLAAKIGKGAYTPISPKYSQSLHALVKSMLALEPRQRPSVSEVLTQPYLKKHIYNFLKDIAERAALGLGAAPPSQVMAGKAPISEGTMVFKAAAQKAGGVGQSGPDAAAHAAAAGLGPHAMSLQAQLVALGLKDVALKALQDAVQSTQSQVSPQPSITSSAAAPAPAVLKPAYSLANLNAGPAPSSGAAAAAAAAALMAKPASAPAPAPAPSSAGAAALPVAPVAAVPMVMGPDGRPLSPNRARKYLKEQQAALQREEERKKAVELALQRLKQERDLRAKGRDDLRRKQEARLSGGIFPGLGPVPSVGGQPPLSAALPGGGPQQLSQAQAQAQAQAVRAYLLGQPAPAPAPAMGIAAAGGAKVAVGIPAVQAGLPPRPSGGAGIPAIAGMGGQAPALALGNRPSAGGSAGAAPSVGGGVRGVGVSVSSSSSNPASRASSQERAGGPGSAGGSRPSSSGSGMPSASSAAGAGGAGGASGSGVDKASELRDRAERIRRDTAAAEAARRARSDAAVAKMLPGAGAGALAPAPSAGGGGAVAGLGIGQRPSVGGVVSGSADRQRVADLDSWEREKGVAGAGGLGVGRSNSNGGRPSDAAGAAARVIAAGKAVPIGVSALQAAAAAQGIAPVNLSGRGAGPTASGQSSRDPSSERASSSAAASAASAASAAAAKAAVVKGMDVPSGVPANRVGSATPSIAGSVASSVSMPASEGGMGMGGGGAVISGRPAVPSSGAAGALRVAAPVSSSVSGRASGPSPTPAMAAGGGASSASAGVARAPSPAPAGGISATNSGGSAAGGAGGAMDEPSTKARVMALKEARKRAEEEMHKQQLEAAARDAATERKRAQYMSREAYRGINAAVVGGLPVAPAVLDASLEEAQDLVKTLSQALPGARYGGEGKEGSGKYSSTEGKSGEDGDEEGAGGGGADELPSASQYEAGRPASAAVVLGKDGLPLDYVPAPVDEDAVGASTRHGELPADLDADSEDEVWLEAGQAPPPSGGAEEGGKPSIAVPGGAARPTLASPPAMVEDDDDIVESESVLRAELARSTLRCAELRQSLVVARKVAETVGVPLPSSARGRRSSGVSSVTAASVIATTGGMALPSPAYPAMPAAGGAAAGAAAAGAGAGAAGAFRPTIVDDRPIRPATNAAGGGAAAAAAAVPGGGAAAAATARPAGNFPPRPGGVLAPSAARTAAEGGYLASSSSRGPSPTPAVRKPSPAPSAVEASGSTSPVRLTGAPAQAMHVLHHGHPVIDTGAGTGGVSPARGAPAGGHSAYSPELADGDVEDDDALEDEDDLRDEDGDEEGQVAFAPRPLVTRTPAGKMHSATIREEDEDEYNEDEDDDDGPFGGEFKSRLGLEGKEDEDGAAGGGAGMGGADHYAAGGAGRGGVPPSPAVGGLSSRVEDLRRRCIACLGASLYEAVYAAVKEVAWDGGSEGAEPGGDPDAEEVELASIPVRYGLTAQQAPVVKDIALLLQMEQDL